VEEVVYSEASHERIGDVSLSYRIRIAIYEGKVFEDKLGRPIKWIEGVILRGRGKKPLNAREVILDVHRQVEKDYLEFWDSTQNQTIRSSKPFEIEIETLSNSGNGGSEESARPYQLIPPRRRISRWLSSIMAVLIGVVAIVWVMGERNKPEDIYPGGLPMDGGPAFDFHAVVRKGAPGDGFTHQTIFKTGSYSVGAVAVKNEVKALLHKNGEHVLYVVSGQGKMAHGDTPIALQPGMIVRIPRGIAYSIKADGGELTLVDFAQPSLEPHQIKWVK
jgi:mannose-6-phosphate isomerase-like protein (cupin superfamily)